MAPFAAKVDAPAEPGKVRIRPAERYDVHLLPQLERKAATRFPEHGYGDLLPGVAPSHELLERRQLMGTVWVAVDQRNKAVGFATASLLDGVAHLDDLHVVPEHGRLGVGTSLLETVCLWAWRSASPAITLATLKKVPWNEPFYRDRGFRRLSVSEYSDALVRLRELERAAGLPIKSRVMMRRDF